MGASDSSSLFGKDLIGWRNIFFMRLLVGIVILMLVFASNMAAGALVKGDIYDADTLSLAENAIVRVNTVPEQMKVADNGSYSFEIPAGNYTITAAKYENKTPVLVERKNLSIVDNGTYVLDLLLFPETDFLMPALGNLQGDGLENEMPNVTSAKSPDVMAARPDNSTIYLQAGALLLALLAAAWFVLAKAQGKSLPSVKKSHATAKKRQKTTRPANPKEEKKLIILTADQKQAIGILRSSGGVATQKEVRRAMPYSESNVSLVLTELEEVGLVKRFKRGRGNIIKLLK